MKSNGFTWVAGKSRRGSGGNFGSGEYVRGNWRVEIHFRYSLGLVTYHVGDTSVEHPAYMRAQLGSTGENRYPGFSSGPLDGFRHLAHDLANFCGAFLSGSEREFQEIAKKVDADAKITGFKRLP